MRKFLIQIEHLITIGAGREQFGANKAKPIRGWTRREIADRAGVNEPDLSRMLHGQKIINRAVADRLAEIFFIDLASEDAVQFKKSYEHYAFHAASADLNYFKCSARHRTGDLFLERQSELSYLNTFFKSAKPLLFITDLGGQGKSSLAWNWISFSLRASKVSKDAVMK
jgi:transcriptional regulator with XRE-family HTH domain